MGIPIGVWTMVLPASICWIPMSRRLLRCWTLCISSGVLRRSRGDCLGVDEEGEVVASPDHPFLSGEQLRGYPSMAGVCRALLDGNWGLGRDPFWPTLWLRSNWDGLTWSLLDEAAPCCCRGSIGVLGGSLLAHPRGMALLHWDDVPLHFQPWPKVRTPRWTVPWPVLLAVRRPCAGI